MQQGREADDFDNQNVPATSLRALANRSFSASENASLSTSASPTIYTLSPAKAASSGLQSCLEAVDAASAHHSNYEIPANAVLVNVYDIVGANAILYPFGLGVHHTGVEVHGVEYAFGRCSRGTGVFDLAPRTCPGHVFRESLLVGVTDLTQCQVAKVVSDLSRMWDGPEYHIIRRNCNHFSATLVQKIINIASRNAPCDSTYLYSGGGVEEFQEVLSPTGVEEDGRDVFFSEDGGSSGGGHCRGERAPGGDSDACERRGNDAGDAMDAQLTAAGSWGGAIGKRRKLFPSWANRLARLGELLPESLIAKIDFADKKAQGLA